MSDTTQAVMVDRSAPYSIRSAQDQSIYLKSQVQIAHTFMEERLALAKMSANDLDVVRVLLSHVKDAASNLCHNLHEIREPDHA